MRLPLVLNAGGAVFRIHCRIHGLTFLQLWWMRPFDCLFRWVALSGSLYLMNSWKSISIFLEIHYIFTDQHFLWSLIETRRACKIEIFFL